MGASSLNVSFIGKRPFVLIVRTLRMMGIIKAPRPAASPVQALEKTVRSEKGRTGQVRLRARPVMMV
jgi:hypothetical protein